MSKVLSLDMYRCRSTSILQYVQSYVQRDNTNGIDSLIRSSIPDAVRCEESFIQSTLVSHTVTLSVIVLSVILLSVIVLSVIVLSVIVLSVIVLSVIMLSVIVLSVVGLTIIMLSVIVLSVIVAIVIVLSIIVRKRWEVDSYSAYYPITHDESVEAEEEVDG